MRSDLGEFEYKPLGQLVELGSDFAVNEVMGVRFTGVIAAVFWRMAYLVRLNSPQSKVRIAADWIFGLFLRPAVTQIRSTSRGIAEPLRRGRKGATLSLAREERMRRDRA